MPRVADRRSPRRRSGSARRSTRCRCSSMLVVTRRSARSTCTRTVMGRHVFAFGGNAEASRFSGLRAEADPDRRVRRSSGLTAGLAAFLGASFYGSASCGDATGYELYVIASAVVGGASLTGGKGSAISAMLGAAAHRAHSTVDPDAALRSELRVDHHRLRDHHRGRARPGERAVRGAAPGAAPDQRAG